MCMICYDGRCPDCYDDSDMPPVMECWRCGEGIYEGDMYYEIKGSLCGECLIDEYRSVAVAL